MPLRTLTVGRQRSLATIAKAVYDVGNDAAALERAVTALRDANPHAREDAALASGVTLMVPTVPGLRATGSGTVTADDRRLALALERAEALKRVADSTFTRALDEAKRWQREAAAKETTDAILSARPDLKAEIPVIKDKAAERVKKIGEAAKVFASTLDEALGALKQQR